MTQSQGPKALTSVMVAGYSSLFLIVRKMWAPNKSLERRPLFMKKYLLAFAIAAIAAISFFAPKTVNAATKVVRQTEEDKIVAPDKYNTGVNTSTKLTPANVGTIGGVVFDMSGSEFALRGRKNAKLSGTYTISNVDFSNNGFRVYWWGENPNRVKIIFKNCKFGQFRGFEEGTSLLSFEFNNCTFMQMAGSNMTFNNCYFGGGIADGLVPYNNVFVNNCYFADKCQQNLPFDGVHTDGTQIYGSKTAGCSNIHYENCRFEMPILLNAANSVNAPLMLQIEFCNANDITFNNCKVNGGGYSIYARAVKGYSITNSALTNITVGCAHRWGGWVYPDVTSTIEMDEINGADSLYVGSVWKKSGKIHVSVSNDTNETRKILIRTEKGDKTFTVKPCYTYSQLNANVSFNDYPFDVDLQVSGNNYVICYDITDGTEKQIRFVNYTGKDVVLQVADVTPKAEIMALAKTAEVKAAVAEVKVETKAVEVTEVASGECGKSVKWTFYSDGKLVLSGQGKTYDYHSGKLPGWWSYRGKIKSLEVSDEITALGNYLFRECTALVDVKIGKKVETLGTNTFSRCTSLRTLVIPASVKSVYEWCFNSTSIKTVTFEGSVKPVISGHNGNVK